MVTEKLKIQVALDVLHPGQREIADDSTRHRVIAPGRQWGKTTFLQRTACEAILYGRHVGWYAPEYKRLDEPFRRILKTIPAEIIVARDMNAKRLELKGGGILKGWTLEDLDAGRGSTDHIALVDEAGLIGDIDRIWHENIMPTLARHRGRAIFSGTPKGRNGFWRLACLGVDQQQSDWAFHAAPSGDNPYLPREFMDEARQSMPSRSFKQEILGEFLDDGGEVISGLDELIQHGVTEIQPQSGHTYRAGLDLAKSVDYSVLSIFDQDSRQVRLERWQGVPWAETIRRAVQIVRLYGASLTVDATGVGDPIFDAIKREWALTEAFKFTEQSRADLLNQLVLQFEQMTPKLLDNPAQRSELESLEWVMTPRGKGRLQVPNSMHDDIIMADALAIYSVNQPRRSYQVYD